MSYDKEYAKEADFDMKSQKILVVLTGGTIGSVSSDSVRGIAGDSPYLLLREFRRQHPTYADCKFDTVNPFSILSENLTPAHWTMLFSILSKTDLSSYQGIIITHGSDTLAYTSAALGMMLRHLPLPIVLVAADRPVGDPKSNAIPNFRAALDFILTGGRKGVFVSYRRYDTGTQAIYLATRLVSADNCRDEFSAYGGTPLGVIKDGIFVPDNTETNPTAHQLNLSYAPVVADQWELSRKVMLLRAYPGMDYAAIDPQGFAAVLQYGYHSATACTEGTNTSLLHFAERCEACGTSLWLGAFKRAEGEMYATSRELLDHGIHPFYDMSPEAAYAKAVLACNLPETSAFTDAEGFMKAGIYYEFVR